MAALPASGGVRSLLAKFENTNNNSNNNNGNNNSGVTIDGSPSRGRASADSQDSATNRPLSKVRASFVSVERNGQSSPTPGILRRAESYSTDVDSSQRSTTVSPTGQLEAASASPFGSSPHKIRTALAAFQNDRVESVTAKLASLAIKDKVQPSSPPEKPDTALKTTATGLQQSAVIEESAKNPTNPSSTKQAAPPKTMKKSTPTVSMMKDSSNNKNTKTATTKPKDAPATTKTPTRSTTTTTRPAVRAEKSVNNKPVTARNTASMARAERATTPHKDGVARAAVEPSPRSTPVSKSPTRPARLPASLVTPTAASSTKTGTLARSQSHVNLRSSPKVENAKTLTRKLSTLKPDSARPSPNSAADRPRSRMSTASSRAPQEESFLARMMRPTASSASKMHDKIEPRSPPRLAKPANLTQKKTTPTKPVAEKKAPQIKPTHKPSDSKQAAAQEVASATTNHEVPPENAKIVESPVISSLAKPTKAEPLSLPATVTESVSKATSEPSPEPSIVEPEAKVTSVELSTEPLAENPVEEQLSDVAEKESGNASTAIGEGLPSVPETDVHEPDNVVEKAEEKPVESVPAKTAEKAKIDVSQAESTPDTSAKVPALDSDASEPVGNVQEATQQPEPTNDSASASLQDKTSENEVQEETEKITLPEETTDAVAGESEATVEHAGAEGDV